MDKTDRELAALAEKARVAIQARDAGIVAHYARGRSLRHIAEVTGVTAPTVQRVLRSAGAATRSPGRPARSQEGEPEAA